MMSTATLTLSNGISVCVEAMDAPSCRIVDFLADIMRLARNSEATNRIRIATSRDTTAWRPGTDLDSPWILGNAEDADTLAVQAMRLASALAVRTGVWGGTLLHGALIAKNNAGVILAGPAGCGKTTACGRLPSSWRALSDDLTLAIRCGPSDYRAHPWPTWSRLMFGGPGGNWDVSHHVRLRGVFFIGEKLSENGDDLLKAPVVVGMLAESAEQATGNILRQTDSAIQCRKRNFQNICDMARELPCRRLDRNGAFWERIEKCI